MISLAPNLELPYTLSTKEIGTSATLKPPLFARTIISIWKTYPTDCIELTSA